MTARRSSSTQRRHRGIPGKTTALSLCLLGSTIAVGGCASRPLGPAADAALTLPGNQDTAAVLAAPRPAAPAGAPRAAVAPTLIQPFTTAPTTFPAPPGTYTTDMQAYTAMSADLLTKTPPLAASPTVNPVDPTPRLEIVGMPMWLWVNSIYETARVPNPGNPDDIVTVRTVVDSVVWNSDLGGGTTLTCANSTPLVPGRGPGVVYQSSMDPTDTAAVPLACVTQAPTSPQYATGTNLAGAPTTSAAVHYYTATVMWHTQYNITPADLPPVPRAALAKGPARQALALAIGIWNDIGGPTPAPGTAQAPLAYRVGEIQALVTGP
jgi:hypothetical protein